MITKNVKQGTAEWLEWRGQGITATDIPVCMGLSPYKTGYGLWMEKTGRANPPDLSGNPNVQRGNRLEDLARQACEERINDVLLPVCAEYSEWPVLRASLDGLCSWNRVFEFKAPSEKVYAELVEQGVNSPTYTLYAWQVKTQLVVADSERGQLYFYMEDGRDLEFDISLTEDDRSAILEAARELWECIETDTAPALDAERDLFIPSSGEGEFKWRTYASEWNDLQTQIKKLDTELKALKTAQKGMTRAMVDEMGDFKSADYAGVKITRFEKRGTIDNAALIEELGVDEATLEKFRKPSVEDVRVTFSKGTVINEDNIGNVSKREGGTGYF